jgi:hypothetical protein
MSGFFSGSLDPFWPHAGLLTVAILASFAVAAGIVMENPKWSLANALVVGGVAIEAACTLLLFGFDEGISASQQKTIVQLLGHRVLSQEQKDRLAAVAQKYPSLNFQMAAIVENEPWGLALEIGDFLKSQGWTWLPCGGGGSTGGPQMAFPSVRGGPTICVFILDGIQVNGANDAVVNALADAIRDPSVVGMNDVRPVPDAAFPTTVLMVGTKL